ncbi:hypothetical protein SLS58_000956 [Diplodia intermedia]|uniref:Malate dehydrogenase n=1 Tax=Diplodia intermedia TaxID=856260 RepID=A0ABR3U3G5_9PEZI
MPTSRTITSILLTILLAAAHLTTGSPISSPAQPDTQARSPHNTHNRRGGTPDLSRLTLPTIAGAATPLPTPPAGYKLKHVALGVGTQNYTCSGSSNGSAESVATPSSAGALASLWDIGPFLSSPLGRLFEDALPPLALAMYGALPPSSSSSSSSSSASDHTWWDAVIAQMPWESTTTSSSSSSSSSTSSSLSDTGLPSSAFGEHFFSSTLTPTWDLHVPAADVVFQGTKEGSAPAPADACPGLGGEGAVPWLYLTKAATTDDGVAAVYRVVTAGGTAPPDACAGMEEGSEVEVKYAAEYWFYGP